MTHAAETGAIWIDSIFDAGFSYRMYFSALSYSVYESDIVLL